MFVVKFTPKRPDLNLTGKTANVKGSHPNHVMVCEDNLITASRGRFQHRRMEASSSVARSLVLSSTFAILKKALNGILNTFLCAPFWVFS